LESAIDSCISEWQIKGQRLAVEQSSGFELMREMISGGKFFMKLLHVLQRSYAAMMNDGIQRAVCLAHQCVLTSPLV
jgi:hypothetical protein